MTTTCTITQARKTYLSLEAKYASDDQFASLCEIERQILTLPIRTVSDAAAMAEHLVSLARDGRSDLIEDASRALSSFLRTLKA